MTESSGDKIPSLNLSSVGHSEKSSSVEKVGSIMVGTTEQKTSTTHRSDITDCPEYFGDKDQKGEQLSSDFRPTIHSEKVNNPEFISPLQRINSLFPTESIPKVDRSKDASTTPQRACLPSLLLSRALLIPVPAHMKSNSFNADKKDDQCSPSINPDTSCDSPCEAQLTNDLTLSLRSTLASVTSSPAHFQSPTPTTQEVVIAGLTPVPPPHPFLPISENNEWRHCSQSSFLSESTCSFHGLNVYHGQQSPEHGSPGDRALAAPLPLPPPSIQPTPPNRGKQTRDMLFSDSSDEMTTSGQRQQDGTKPSEHPLSMLAAARQMKNEVLSNSLLNLVENDSESSRPGATEIKVDNHQEECESELAPPCIQVNRSEEVVGILSALVHSHETVIISGLKQAGTDIADSKAGADATPSEDSLRTVSAGKIPPQSLLDRPHGYNRLQDMNNDITHLHSPYWKGQPVLDSQSLSPPPPHTPPAMMSTPFERSSTHKAMTNASVLLSPPCPPPLQSTALQSLPSPPPCTSSLSTGGTVRSSLGPFSPFASRGVDLVTAYSSSSSISSFRANNSPAGVTSRKMHDVRLLKVTSPTSAVVDLFMTSDNASPSLKKASGETQPYCHSFLSRNCESSSSQKNDAVSITPSEYRTPDDINDRSSNAVTHSTDSGSMKSGNVATILQRIHECVQKNNSYHNSLHCNSLNAEFQEEGKHAGETVLFKASRKVNVSEEQTSSENDHGNDVDTAQNTDIRSNRSIPDGEENAKPALASWWKEKSVKSSPSTSAHSRLTVSGTAFLEDGKNPTLVAVNTETEDCTRSSAKEIIPSPPKSMKKWKAVDTALTEKKVVEGKGFNISGTVDETKRMDEMDLETDVNGSPLTSWSLLMAVSAPPLRTKNAIRGNKGQDEVEVDHDSISSKNIQRRDKLECEVEEGTYIKILITPQGTLDGEEGEYNEKPEKENSSDTTTTHSEHSAAYNSHGYSIFSPRGNTSGSPFRLTHVSFSGEYHAGGSSNSRLPPGRKKSVTFFVPPGESSSDPDNTVPRKECSSPLPTNAASSVLFQGGNEQQEQLSTEALHAVSSTPSFLREKKNKADGSAGTRERNPPSNSFTNQVPTIGNPSCSFPFSSKNSSSDGEKHVSGRPDVTINTQFSAHFNSSFGFKGRGGSMVSRGVNSAVLSPSFGWSAGSMPGGNFMASGPSRKASARDGGLPEYGSESTFQGDALGSIPSSFSARCFGMFQLSSNAIHGDTPVSFRPPSSSTNSTWNETQTMSLASPSPFSSPVAGAWNTPSAIVPMPFFSLEDNSEDVEGTGEHFSLYNSNSNRHHTQNAVTPVEPTSPKHPVTSQQFFRNGLSSHMNEEEMSKSQPNPPSSFFPLVSLNPLWAMNNNSNKDNDSPANSDNMKHYANREPIVAPSISAFGGLTHKDVASLQLSMVEHGYDDSKPEGVASRLGKENGFPGAARKEAVKNHEMSPDQLFGKGVASGRVSDEEATCQSEDFSIPHSVYSMRHNHGVAPHLQLSPSFFVSCPPPIAEDSGVTNATSAQPFSTGEAAVSAADGGQEDVDPPTLSVEEAMAVVALPAPPPHLPRTEDNDNATVKRLGTEDWGAGLTIEGTGGDSGWCQLGHHTAFDADHTSPFFASATSSLAGLFAQHPSNGSYLGPQSPSFSGNLSMLFHHTKRSHTHITGGACIAKQEIVEEMNTRKGKGDDEPLRRWSSEVSSDGNIFVPPPPGIATGRCTPIGRDSTTLYLEGQ